MELHVQKFKERFGFLLATILADKICLNTANRKYLKEAEIKPFCKSLERSLKETKILEFAAKTAKTARERSGVECPFGTGKRIYRTNNIRAKLPETGDCRAGMCYFVKNVMKFLRELCLVLSVF